MAKALTDTHLAKLIKLIKNLNKGTEDKVTALDTRVEQAEQKQGDYLPLSGGTMTGDITMSGQTVTGLKEPETDTDAATKKYADDKAAEVQDTVDSLSGRVDTVEQKQGDYLELAGGTMTGDIGMSDNKITSLGDPTDEGDGVNKKYTDAEIESAKTELNASIQQVKATADEAHSIAEQATGAVDAIVRMGDETVTQIWNSTPATN